MKYTFTGIFLFFALTSGAQNFFFTAFGGFSNYTGDLQDKRFTIEQAHAAFGGGLVYELTENFYIRAGITAGKISADDKKSKNFARNLNFTSAITDFHVGLEYQVFSLYRYHVTPYVFLGIARYDFNPYTLNHNGDVTFLNELSTEGQGFYQNRKPYKLKQVSIPIGAGLLYAINNNIRAGFELGIRKTFTDYLDDVSTTYIDENILSANRGSNAVAMAYRGNETPFGSPFYPAEGTPRGNPANKDWYYFAGVTIRYRLVPRYKRREMNTKVPKSRVTCPRW